MRHGLLQIATRFITNCDGTCTWSTLTFWSTFQSISISSYRPLTSLTSYTKTDMYTCFFRISYTKTDMYTCFFRIPHNTFCLFSNLHKFLLSKALQEIFNPPNSLCRKGGKQCIMGNSNHSILCICTNEFLSKMNQNREKIIIIWSWTCDHLQSKVLPKVP